MSKKFKLLNLQSARALKDYKAGLYINSESNRKFTKTCQIDFIKNLLSAPVKFAIFVQIFFSQNHDSLSELLVYLKTHKIKYTVSTPSLFLQLDSTVVGNWISSYTKGGLVLSIDAEDNSTYHTLISMILKIEADASEEIFNRVHLSFTKEAGRLISFNLKNVDLRLIYRNNSTKSTILLEVLDTINSPAVDVTNTLTGGVNTFGTLPCELHLPLFPFKLA